MMSEMAQTPPRWRLIGLACAGTALLADQTHKLHMLYRANIIEGEVWPVTSFLDVVLVWNRGISYGLFQQNHETGRLILIGVTVVAIVALGVWLWRCGSRLLAAGLGLIIGGAIGNAIDRVAYGAVADFFHLHWGSFSWYVFNVADCAIVAGAALILYDGVASKPSAASQSP